MKYSQNSICFTSSFPVTIAETVHNQSKTICDTFKSKCAISRRPRSYQSVFFCCTEGINQKGNAKSSNSSSVPQLHPQESYLQCVQCYAVYAVEPEELEGAPRVVACSNCLHEWYATEADLLWGEDEARLALKEASERHIQAGGSSTFVPARTVLQQQQNEEKQPTKTEIPNSSNLQSNIKGQKRKSMKQNDATSRNEKEEEEKNMNTAQQEGQNTSNDKNPTEYQKETNSSSDEDSSQHFNVFVGNLSFRATEQDLFRAFSGYGSVLKCQVPSDETGASRGYGFVKMEDRESGLRAIESLQGTSILGRDVSLNEARPRKEFNTNNSNFNNSGKKGKGKPTKKTIKRWKDDQSTGSKFRKSSQDSERKR